MNPVLRRWRRRLGLVFITYLLLMVTLAGCADRLILFPSRQPIAVPGATRTLIPAPAGQLEIWRLPTPTTQLRTGTPHAFVLAFIGNASRAEYEAQITAQEWSNQPVEVWAVNFPGFGGSDGKATLAGIPPASLAAYDALALHAAGRPIYISANSIGTTAGLYVAANRPVAGVVLRNPPPMRQLLLGRHGWWNLWIAASLVAWQVPSELDSLSNAPKLGVPAVFVLCEEDSVVPMPYKQRVVKAVKSPTKLVLLPGADHNDPLSPEAETQLHLAIDWLVSGGK